MSSIAYFSSLPLRSTNINRMPSAERRNLKTNAVNSFQSSLRNRIIASESFPELLKGLDDAGKKLTQSVDLDDFEAYRDKLRDIIHELSSKSQLLKPIHNGTMQIVIIVDKELEGIYNNLFKQQGSKLELLARVDKIRALIVDASL